MIDTHHHLWDLAVRDQPWLTGDQQWATEEQLTPLRRSFTVADLESAAVPEGVSGTVVVQVLADPAETADLLAIAGAGGLVKAAVGWADLTAPGIAGQIAAYRRLPGGDRLAGIRHPLLAEPDPDWLTRPAAASSRSPSRTATGRGQPRSPSSAGSRTWSASCPARTPSPSARRGCGRITRRRWRRSGRSG